MNKSDELLEEYDKIFPNDPLFPEYYEATEEDKISMLTEAIEKKVDIMETQVFEDKYMEKVIRD